MSFHATSSSTGRPSNPPVVVPGGGNNIIVNPCQVRCLQLMSQQNYSSTLQRGATQCSSASGMRGRSSERSSPTIRLGEQRVYYFSGACSYIGLSLEGLQLGSCPISLRYHRLHPEYIHQRIEKLGHAYNLRILLLMCDVVRAELYSVCWTMTKMRAC